MQMSGFICHDDYLEKTARLSDTELGRVFRALMVYHRNHTEPELNERESMVFDFIKVDIDRTEKKYQEKCDKNREIRLAAIEKNERERSSTNVIERDQYKENKIKEKEKEKTISFIDVNDAEQIVSDHDKVLSAAENAGFARNDATRAKLIDLYAVHGLQKMLDGINSCVDHSASNIAYLSAVLKGEPKKVKISKAGFSRERSYDDEQADAERRMIEEMKKAGVAG